MAEKISIQIALAGGAEVQRQLEDIGASGQKAFNDLAMSAEQVGGFKNLKTDEVTAGLKAAGVEGKELAQILKAVSTAARFETLVQGVQSIESAFVALGRAAGPVGLAIATGLQAVTSATISFADAMTKASDQAVKLGLSLEGFKKAQADLAKIGVTGQAAAEGLKKMNEATEQLKLDEVNKAAAEFKRAFAGDFAGAARRQFATLIEAAKGVGPAADAARKALVDLGQPIPTDAPKTLAQLGGNLAAFRQQLQGMPDSLSRTNLAIASLGERAGTQLIQGIRAAEGSMSAVERKAFDLGQAIGRLKTVWEDFGSVQFAPAITAGIDAITIALTNLSAKLAQNPFLAWVQVASMLNPINLVVQGIINAVGNLASTISSIAWGAISSAAVTAWNAIKQAVSEAGQTIATFVSSLAGITWDAISNAGVAAWNAITGAIQGAIDKLLQFIGLKPSAPATGGSAPGAARGGLLGGRGTGTSDSNLAWLSRGEYVTPARAVAQPGVLAFLEALRRSGGNLRGVLDGMGRFALGGLVPRPAFAGGGAVGSMSNVTINFPGLQPISGLRAAADVVDQLQRAAAMAQVRSGGRKPSRYS